jgi:hypothetical protein
LVGMHHLLITCVKVVRKKSQHKAGLLTGEFQIND